MNTAPTRRELITAAGAFAIPAIVPEGVIARKGRPGANDRIVIANIGVGGMGSNHIYPDSAALCDVDESRLATAAKRVTIGNPFLTTDYRRILDRKDIDAITNGTPDHWHAFISIHACQAGKHVYTEKPTCRTLGEGKAMVAAARRYNRVVQVGAQGRSNENAQKACQYVRNGQLGTVRRVEIWHPDNPVSTHSPGSYPVPQGLNWDQWVGPAKWREYHPAYHPANFRWFMDLGGGQIRDRGNHAMNMVCWLMNHDGYRGKVTVEATGRKQTQGVYDAPLGLEVRYEFEDPAWTLYWSQKAVPTTHSPWGASYIGTQDSLILIQGDGAANTDEKAKRYTPPTGGEVYLHPAPGGTPTTDRHRMNWLDCIKTGKRPATDIEIGYRTCTYCILGNMAWTLGRKLTWDMGAERFVNDAEANGLIDWPYRAGWKLG